MRRVPDFNPVARAYRWAEYCTFGHALERCRFHFLASLAARQSTNALVLGDGDGRFLGRLLAQNRTLQADAVDCSSAMLALLSQRCSDASVRVTPHLADARTFTPPRADYDLIATHFFLDCLTGPELDAFIPRIASHTRPGALWIVSEFHVPERGPLRMPAAALVRLLYVAFRALTGLRPTRLPNHAAALATSGFRRISHQPSLGGLLVSELWQRGT